ncbi:2-C-methyl-D-erythritol 4-phosphate cytidylyltransferase [Enterococcus sp. BWM-S5]|uniref:2-C-methyl-D-erythritol 4-phosphate cytidylyltransferase n=1 Tax=Enterococcus larvae TaxID=2794352 RepID=A0ABS4CIQ2_9ENTE|nr:IspD/TarI family cytidylyltransferase [Enterococcus larvae]MBP1046354.1 2-C-methyl-D-erythritol 4-phosphate cytidylyltransferase [Enterococcus larvae]
MNVALIFAGGVGSRMKNDSLPKQFLELDGKPIIIHTLDVFENNPNIDAIVVVCKAEWLDYMNELLQKFELKKVFAVIAGGATALDSQYQGLLAIDQQFPQEEVIVLIHDGVRPIIDDNTINNNIELVKLEGAAITVSPAIETVTYIADEKLDEIFDREKCRLAKAPQSFLLKNILKAHKTSIDEEKRDFIDSASLMKYYGFSLGIVEGETENIKITTPSDYYLFKTIYEMKKEYNFNDGGK